MQKNNGFALAFTIIIVVAVMAVGSGAFYYYEKTQTGKRQTQIETSDEIKGLVENSFQFENNQREEDNPDHFDVSDFLVVPFETCGIQTAPDIIQNHAREIEEEIISYGGWVKNTICKIDLDDNPVTEEFILQSDDPGQNNSYYLYRMVDRQWKIILETNSAGVYISKNKKNGFCNILFSAHVSAAERYWELYSWDDNLKQYEMIKKWTENY